MSLSGVWSRHRELTLSRLRHRSNDATTPADVPRPLRGMYAQMQENNMLLRNLLDKAGPLIYDGLKNNDALLKDAMKINDHFATIALRQEV